MSADFQPKKIKDAEDLRKELKPIAHFALAPGLELWKVNVAVLQEQSLNARSMPSDMFLQLTDNIKRRGSLESFPLAALTQNGLEIVSGHHRVRAARKAEVLEIWVIVDTTMMSPDALRAKQLAHNRINGVDNDTLVRQIFDLIKDVDAKIESFVEPKINNKDVNVELSTKDLEVEFDVRVASIVFLPAQFDVLKHALTLLEGQEQDNELFLAKREEYEMLVQALDKGVAHFNITSTPTLIAKMCQIVIEKIEAEQAAAAQANGGISGTQPNV